MTGVVNVFINRIHIYVRHLNKRVGYKTPTRETPNYKTLKDLTFSTFFHLFVQNVKNNAGLRPGIARCSLRSQTFACPFLYYCLSLHIARIPLMSFFKPKISKPNQIAVRSWRILQTNFVGRGVSILQLKKQV